MPPFVQSVEEDDDEISDIKEWLINDFLQQRGKEEPPLPYSFEDLTVKGSNDDMIIAAASGGDVTKGLELSEYYPLSEVYRMLSLINAINWKPKKKEDDKR